MNSLLLDIVHALFVYQSYYPLHLYPFRYYCSFSAIVVVEDMEIREQD